jgi:hypothetical protein
MKTSFKIAIVNIVVVMGSVAIILALWPEAIKPRSYGGGYEQGWASAFFLAAVLTGIPTVMYAAIAHLALSQLLFKPGELKAHRARQLIESLETAKPAASQRTRDVVHDD